MTLPEGAPREPSHFSEDLWKCAVVAKKFSRPQPAILNTYYKSVPLPKSNNETLFINHTGKLFPGIARLTPRLLIVVC